MVNVCGVFTNPAVAPPPLLAKKPVTSPALSMGR
jgi:hypothetical protein